MRDTLDAQTSHRWQRRRTLAVQLHNPAIAARRILAPFPHLDQRVHLSVHHAKVGVACDVTLGHRYSGWLSL